MPPSPPGRPMKPLRLTLVAWMGWALLLAAGPGAAQELVPAGYRGVWGRDGDCAAPSARLVISAQSAALGDTMPGQVVFYPDDRGPGMGGLHWAEQGNADNFTLADAGSTLVHALQGYGAGPNELYRRCPAR